MQLDLGDGYISGEAELNLECVTRYTVIPQICPNRNTCTLSLTANSDRQGSFLT